MVVLPLSFAARENILRPDFVGLFLYLFPKEASQLANLDTLLGQAGLTDYDLTKDGFSYQTPGMWAVADMPSSASMLNANSLENPFQLDSSVDDSLIELSGGANPSDARRMRRARNENSVVLVVTHKGPRSEDQAILHGILGCSKRKILVVYMPSGIYEPEINSYDAVSGTGTTLTDYQSHGRSQIYLDTLAGQLRSW